MGSAGVYYDMREVSDRLCKENGLSVIPPSQNKGMGYKEYTEAKRGTSWKQKLKQTIDRLVITAKDYDDFLRLMQEAGYETKTGKYISFRAEGQERFTRSKTIGENYTEERIKERIAGRTPRRSQRQTTPKGISLIGDIQERIRLIDSKGYEHKAKLIILKEAARTLNYLTENNLLQYADLEKKVEDVHGSYDRTGKELKGVEARLREVQPLIKNISNYQRLKPVYDAFQKAKDKPGFKARHEAEIVIFEAARSTLLAMQGDEKLPRLKALQAEQAQLFEEQERLYVERNRLKKEAKQIETIKSNVDTFLAPSAEHDRTHLRNRRVNINAGVAVDDTGCTGNYVLPDVEYCHHDVKRVRHEIDRHSRLEKPLEEHPSVHIVKVVFLGDHRNQLVAQNEGDDDTSDGDYHVFG